VPSASTTLGRASVWLTLASAACAAGRAAAPIVPPEIAQAIPPNARAVKVYSDQLPADYFLTVERALLSRGFGINRLNEDRQSGYLSTDYQDLPTTSLKLSLVVEAAPGGSVATLRGEWRDSDSSNDMNNIVLNGLGLPTRKHGESREAIWKRGTRAAFGQMAVIASALPHTRVEYVTR